MRLPAASSRSVMTSQSTCVLALLVAVALVACRGAEPVRESATTPPPTPPYPVSERGGTPAIGPENRYNSCERIWCLVHGENFFIEHFLAGHVGFLVHDDERGDVFVPREREGGPALAKVHAQALFLCGAHVHPWLLREHREGGSPIRITGFHAALGYARAHFLRYGTRIDPCCINGAGSAYVHSTAGKQFRFHELDEFRRHPEIGWQRPFVARAAREGDPR